MVGTFCRRGRVEEREDDEDWVLGVICVACWSPALQAGPGPMDGCVGAEEVVMGAKELRRDDRRTIRPAPSVELEPGGDREDEERCEMDASGLTRPLPCPPCSPCPLTILPASASFDFNCRPCGSALGRLSNTASRSPPSLSDRRLLPGPSSCNPSSAILESVADGRFATPTAASSDV